MRYCANPFFSTRHGFALPTVLIAGTALLIMLSAGLVAVSSVSAGINQQYYQKLALESAEAGAVRAQDCLAANGYVSTWPTNPLYPNTSCTGAALSPTTTAPCTNVAACFVYKGTAMSTSFKVMPLPAAANTSQVVSYGSVSIYRKNGTVATTYTYQSNGRVGTTVSATNVTFGYNNSGAYFGTIGADGKVRTVGLNSSGQLGNGSTTNSATPSVFTIGSSPAAALYSNFVSLGSQMFAVDATGTLWGAGYNYNGDLGNASNFGYGNQTTPVQFNLPAGVTVNSTNGYQGAVDPDGLTTYVLGSNNVLYSAGQCYGGKLGSSYTIAGCSDQYVPQVVTTSSCSASPDYPTANLTSDRDSAYVIMNSGKVCGWGMGDLGQLGVKSGSYYSYANSSVPVQIGTLGNSGQPKATQIAFDGDTLYILDSNGNVSSIGSNSFGQSGSPNGSFINAASGNCIDNKAADGVTLRLYGCNGTAAQIFQMQVNADGSVTLYNANKNVCFDDAGAAGTTVRLYTCNGSAAQKWVNTGRFQWASEGSGKCIDNEHGDGATLWLYTCNGTSSQSFMFGNSTPVPLVKPSGMTGTVTKIWTDQSSLSMLTSTGQVWTAGANATGQAGNGTSNLLNPTPLQFTLPSGVTATNIYETSTGVFSTPLQNLFVIGSDGKVYGAGSNSYGQLGNGTTATKQVTPVAMMVIDGTVIQAKLVQSGDGTTVIFTSVGKVYTVGNNNVGQLGSGSMSPSYNATPAANSYTNPLPLTLY